MSSYHNNHHYLLFMSINSLNQIVNKNRLLILALQNKGFQRFSLTNFSLT